MRAPLARNERLEPVGNGRAATLGRVGRMRHGAIAKARQVDGPHFVVPLEHGNLLDPVRP